MLQKRKICLIAISGFIALLFSVTTAYSLSEQFKGKIYNPGTLKPVDSVPKLKVGDKSPDFKLSAVSGDKVSLSQYIGNKNVVISFVPAAWTPVCSDQWPGYNIAKGIFDKNDT